MSFAFFSLDDGMRVKPAGQNAKLEHNLTLLI
jgi:hypothetical protein